MTPTAKVIAFTQFVGVPAELAAGGITADQDQGSDAARLIECAGRCCYDSYSKGRGSDAFHQHLKEVGHGSVIEHASLSFYLSGISRGCTHELVRHRHAAISQRSTRYVEESESLWAWHPLIEALRAGKDWQGLADLEHRAREMYQAIGNAAEGYLQQQGLTPTAARKQARGAARGALGNALSTALVWTVNLRSLRHFLELRATEHADAEIRLLANAVYEAALPVAPEWLADYERVEMADGIGYGLVTPWRRL